MGFILDKNSEYFISRGVDVMAYSDCYPEGHQSGVCIIMHGKRIATNGDVRFEPTPGQWQPVPKQDSREVCPEEQRISTVLHYPDESTHLRGFNPRIYPDFRFSYTTDVITDGGSIIVTVHLDCEIPDEFAGKLCFNLELFPGELFGKSYLMDDDAGVFPRHPNGPALSCKSNRHHTLHFEPEGICADIDALCGDGEYNPMIADDIIAKPYAVGHCLTLCPEDDYLRFTVESDCELKLYDGRFNHNNGWFVLSSELPQNRTANALRWVITPNVVSDYIYKPVVQVSNVGYHPAQPKTAVIELDRNDTSRCDVELYRLSAVGRTLLKTIPHKEWGNFLRYSYLTADFSDTAESGSYIIKYGDTLSPVFRIGEDVYDRGVWQPVIEYFLPIQMCHMRVSEKYRIWHGLCHMDDAVMAPLSLNHFDGYIQGSDTLTEYRSGDSVPGLNAGGWHDAGDFDLRIESQSGEAYILAQICEEFGADYDATTIDQQHHLVEIHQPDGINDFFQQIEHGLLSVLGGYKALGRLYRGIICKDLRQYVLMGDASVMTDGIPGSGDDRLVFTECNPVRELYTAAHLACCGRVLAGYNDTLACEAVSAAKELYAAAGDDESVNALADILYRNHSAETLERIRTDIRKARVHAAAELYLTSRDKAYLAYIVSEKELILSDMTACAHMVAKVWKDVDDAEFRADFSNALYSLHCQIADMGSETPYGIPYRPYIWGAGWGIQAMAVKYYYLHKHFPEIFNNDMLFRSLDFILGTHPGSNNASFASGVGSKSMLTAYGANRADWSYIPGGVVSGTALIRPDFPELLEFPFLWQQAEYVLGGGSSNFMFLVLAVKKELERTE